MNSDATMQESDTEGRSAILQLVASLFLVSGVLGLAVALYGFTRSLMGRGFPADWGHYPGLSLGLLLVVSAVWLITGRALLARRRSGGILALAAIGLELISWTTRASRGVSEFVFVLVALGLTVFIWKELRPTDRGDESR